MEIDRLRNLTIATLISLFLAACGATLPPTPAQTATLAPPAIPSPTTVPAPTVAPTPIPGTLFVDPSRPLCPISPLIYGSNYGPWLTVPFYMLPEAYDSGIKILRFPGGEFGDHNNVTHLQIAVTEFNSSHAKSVGGDTTLDSYYNAIRIGDVLGRMIKNRVFMSNEFALTAKGA